MKTIDTSAVNSNRWLPLLGNYGGSGVNSFATTGGTGSMAGIDFIQQAYTECLNAIAQFAIANTTEVTVMYGCNKFYTPPLDSIFDTYYESYYAGSNSYGINPGWIYYQGELYYVAGMAYTTVPTSPFTYVNATITTTYSTADPAVFSASGSHNIHVIRTIAFSLSTTAHTSGSGAIIPDYNNWVFANPNAAAVAPATAVFTNWLTNTWNVFTTAYTALTTPPITVVGSTDSPQFENGWAVTGVSGSNPLSYYKVLNRVCIWGEVELTVSAGPIKVSTIFHLPPGYHPLSTEEVFAVPDITNANYSAGGNNAGGTYYIWVQSDGSVTFLGNVGTSGSSTTKVSLSGITFLAGVYTPPAQVLAPISNQTNYTS